MCTMKRHTHTAVRLLFAGLLLGIVAMCRAQGPFQYQFAVSDGLPYVEVAGVRFSQKGEVWINYSSGDYLSRFDGVNWTHYRLDSLGLPLQLNILHEDRHGFWLNAYNHDALTLVRFTSDEQWKIYKVERHLIPYFDTHSNCLKLLGDGTFTYAYDPAKDAFTRSRQPLIRNAQPNPPGYSYHIYYNGNKETFIDGRLVTNYTGVLYFGENYRDSLFTVSNQFRAVDPAKKKFIIQRNDQYFFQSGGTTKAIQAVLPDGTMGSAKNYVQLYEWENGPVQTQSNGFVVKHPTLDINYLYELHDDGSMELLLSHLAGNFQRFFARDPQGNWWYASSTGIVRSDRSQLVFDERNPEMVNGLHTIVQDVSGNTWFGGYNGQGGFAVYDGQRLKRRVFTKNAMPVLPGSFLSGSGTIYFFGELGLGLSGIRDGKFTSRLLPDFQTGFYIRSLSDGRLAFGLLNAGLAIAEEKNGAISNVKMVRKEKGLLLDNVLTITEDRAGRLWAGRTSQGIALYDPVRDTAVTWLRSIEQPGSIGILSSCLGDDGAVWFGGHNGLYRLPSAQTFDYLHRNVFDFLEKIQLPGNENATIAFLQNTPDYLVAGGQQAVYFIDRKYKGKQARIFTLQYGKRLPGSGSEQNAVLYDNKGFLWIGTQEGAVRLDLSLLRFDTTATTLLLQRFTAGGELVDVTGSQIGRLPAKKRNITFSFSPSGNTLLQDDLFFDIAVVNGLGDTLFWRSQTKERDSEMPYLPQGNYTIRITAYKHNVVSGQAAWQFTVSRLPSENPWIWAGLALVVLSIPFTYFYLKKRHQAELERSKRERDALQIRALSNFFNPHFINNALHWVQSRYRKDAETATIIGRLSDNVDLLFENTQGGRACHSLKKELEIVRNYLKIQQIRFGQGLHVTLDLPQDEEAISDVVVPAMLLQIHAENAVEKGIRNRREADHFSLSVKMEADGCHISIVDDGPGRQSPLSDRKGSTAVMDDLIALFNRYNSQPLTVRYENFIFGEPGGTRHGLRVIFFIPNNYNYDLS